MEKHYRPYGGALGGKAYPAPPELACQSPPVLKYRYSVT